MAVQKIDERRFHELISGEKPVLVDFSAPWCGYCRRIDPAYEKISGQYAELLHAVKVDIDEEPALADAERIEVVPTLVLYADGKALGSIVAPGSKAAIDAFIREYLEV